MIDIFYNNNEEYCGALRQRVAENYPDKSDKVTVLHEDCNELLQRIDSRQWFSEGWRGVIFLDPYAMELDWVSVEKISKTRIFDVWYLFPYSAVTRNLNNDGKIKQATEERLNKIFGTDVWKTEIYTESAQLTLFGESEIEKLPDGLKKFIIKRLEETFPKVAQNPVELKNKTNSTLFLLCFAVSNPNPSAWKPALNIANHILRHTED